MIINILTTLVTDGCQIYCDGRFLIYINFESLSCTAKTNVILYVNCTSIKKRERKRLIAKKAMSERIQEGDEGTEGNKIPGFSGKNKNKFKKVKERIYQV